MITSAPGRAVAASAQAHYTHSRLSAVLGVPFCPIAIDARGRMDSRALERELSRGDVGTVVATSFVIELEGLKGRDRLAGYEVVSLLKY